MGFTVIIIQATRALIRANNFAQWKAYGTLQEELIKISELKQKKIEFSDSYMFYENIGVTLFYFSPLLILQKGCYQTFFYQSWFCQSG